MADQIEKLNETPKRAKENEAQEIYIMPELQKSYVAYGSH